MLEIRKMDKVEQQFAVIKINHTILFIQLIQPWFSLNVPLWFSFGQIL